MAIYHFSSKIVGASKGKSVVASASYVAGVKLFDERLGRTFNYTSKDEVIFSKVLLPEYAPARLADNETLWNEVTHIEKSKHKNAQYARNLDIALPIEWTREQCISYGQEFVQKTFVDEGMIALFSIHFKDGNPHLHVLLTLRPLTRNGEWGAKEKKAYKLDDHGERIPVMDPATGEQKVDKRNRKQWVRETVQANNWNSRKVLYAWRKAWAEFANERLPEEKHIDHRSYKEQGIEKIPTIHEGYAARKIEALGGKADRCEYNREVKRMNKLYDKSERLGEEISTIEAQVSERNARTKPRERAVDQPLHRVDRNNSNVGKRIESIRETVSRIRKRVSKIRRRIDNLREYLLGDVTRSSNQVLNQQRIVSAPSREPLPDSMDKEWLAGRNAAIEGLRAAGVDVGALSGEATSTEKGSGDTSSNMQLERKRTVNPDLEKYFAGGIKEKKEELKKKQKARQYNDLYRRETSGERRFSDEVRNGSKRSKSRNDGFER